MTVRAEEEAENILQCCTIDKHQYEVNLWKKVLNDFTFLGQVCIMYIYSNYYTYNYLELP